MADLVQWVAIVVDESGTVLDSLFGGGTPPSYVPTYYILGF